MKIRFETTMDDQVAFHIFHYANSPTWRRQVWLVKSLVPAILALGLLIKVISGALSDLPFPIALGIFGLAISLAWFLYFPRLARKSLEQNVRKLLSEGTNPTLLGWREMELVGNLLVLRTEFIDSRMDLRAIEKIVGNDEYTFVYTDSVSAHLIPMQRWPEAEYRAFVLALQYAWERREDAPITSRVVDNPNITSKPPR